MASVNNWFILLSLLLRATSKTLSHISSQHEIMVGIPVSLSASLQDRMGQMTHNVIFWILGNNRSEQNLYHTWRGRRSGLILSMVSMISDGIQQRVNVKIMAPTALATETSSLWLVLGTL